MIKLDEKFFRDKEFHSISAAALRSFSIDYGEAIEGKLDKIDEIIGNAKVDFSKHDNVELFGCLRKAAYSNSRDLRKEVLRRESDMIDQLLQKMITTCNEVLIDHVIWILGKCDSDIEDKIISMIDTIRYPNVQSGMLQILGYKGSNKSIDILIKYYEHFKRTYPEESYEQGPLYGLWKLGVRFGHVEEEIDLDL